MFRQTDPSKSKVGEVTFTFGEKITLKDITGKGTRNMLAHIEYIDDTSGDPVSTEINAIGGFLQNFNPEYIYTIVDTKAKDRARKILADEFNRYLEEVIAKTATVEPPASTEPSKESPAERATRVDEENFEEVPELELTIGGVNRTLKPGTTIESSTLTFTIKSILVDKKTDMVHIQYEDQETGTIDSIEELKKKLEKYNII